MDNKKFNCNNFKPIGNEIIGSYHNAMSSVMDKPNNCKGCVHYTSRFCNQSHRHMEREQNHHFFC